MIKVDLKVYYQHWHKETSLLKEDDENNTPTVSMERGETLKNQIMSVMQNYDSLPEKYKKILQTEHERMMNPSDPTVASDVANMLVAQSSIATISGDQQEVELLKAIVDTTGVVPVPYSQWIADRKKYKNEVCVLGVPYTTIYGNKGNTEFLLISKKNGIVARIESKRKQRGNDERIPYLYHNMLVQPERHQIAVFGGSGLQNAASWLKAQPTGSKQIDVMTIEEFKSWLISNTKSPPSKSVKDIVRRLISKFDAIKQTAATVKQSI